MAALEKSGTPSLCTVSADAGERIGTFEANEAIAAGDACKLNSSGKVILSTGAAATAAAHVLGFAGTEAAAGEVVTLWANVNFGYGTAAGVTPGAPYYLSGTVAGGLVDAASTGGTKPIAIGLTGGRIRVLQFFG
jgi:hypothetical protein